MRIAISPNLALINPKSQSLLPNAVRSFEYFDDASRIFFAPPTQYAPNVKRPAFNVLKATTCPRPASCRRFSLGTGEFSKNIGVVELPLMPIFFSSAPDENPGVPRSTMKQENFSPSIYANTT